MRNRFVLSILLSAVLLLLIAPAAAWSAPGALVWLQTWTPPAGAQAGGESVVRGPGGDLWVGGDIFKTWTSSDIVVMRCSPTGQRRWVKVIDLAPDEYYGDIAVDRFGNTYVAGAVITYKDSKAIDQWRVMKLSPRGRILWVKKRAMPAASPGERAWDVVADSAGNAYFAGQVVAEGISTFAVVKYTPAGRTAWVRTRTMQEEEYGQARAIAIDAAGRVYAAGGFKLPGTNVGFTETARYSANGHLDWHGEFRSFVDSHDALRDIAVSKAGVAVAGSAGGATYADGLVLLYGLGGRLKISSVVPYWLGRTALRWETVAINAKGVVAVGGSSSGTGGKSYFAMATLGGPYGSAMRPMDHDPAGATTGTCRAVAIDAAGRLYGTGSFSDESVHPMHTHCWDPIVPGWIADYGTSADGYASVLTPGGLVVTGSDDGKLVLAKYER